MKNPLIFKKRIEINKKDITAYSNIHECIDFFFAKLKRYNFQYPKKNYNNNELSFSTLFPPSTFTHKRSDKSYQIWNFRILIYETNDKFIFDYSSNFYLFTCFLVLFLVFSWLFFNLLFLAFLVPLIYIIALTDFRKRSSDLVNSLFYN